MQTEQTITPEHGIYGTCEICEINTETYLVWEHQICLFCIGIAVDILKQELNIQTTSKIS